jgi:hypothetical protein
MKPYHKGGAPLSHLREAASPAYSQTIPDILASVDLSALVERYAGASQGGRGQLYSCPNPSHPDASPSFSVFTGRDGKQRAACLSRGCFQGDALAFLKWMSPTLSTGEALRTLQEFAGLPADTRPIRASAPKQRRRLHKTTPPPVIEDARAMSSYLAMRGWGSEVVEAFGLSVMRDARGVLRVRHPFYAYTPQGEKVEAGWQARRLDNSEEVRWLGQKETPLPLYNLPALDSDAITHVVLCEGPADTITAHLALPDRSTWGAVGIAGTRAWAPEYAELFEGLRVIIATDADEAGSKAALEIAKDLTLVASSVMRFASPLGYDLTEFAKAFGCERLAELLASSDGTESVATVETVAPLEFPEVEENCCRVCMMPTYATLCPSCEAWGANSAVYSWRECDECGEIACTSTNRACFMRQGCRGHFSKKVVA